MTAPRLPSPTRLDDLWLALFHAAEKVTDPDEPGDALVDAVVEAVVAAGWRPAGEIS